VTLLTYGDPYRQRLTGAFGFMVNLSWVRQSYVKSLADAIARQANIEPGVSIDFRDEHGASLIGTTLATASVRSVARTVPVAFFDPIVADIQPGSDPVTTTWSAQAVIAEDPSVRAAQSGARRTTLLALVAASLVVFNYVLISRTAAQSAKMGDMRTTFIQGVTHELKTPVATIRAIGETLATSETTTIELTKQLGTLSAEQAKRLTRLIDNLLAYSRITDVTEAYQFESVSLATVIREVICEFSSRLPAEQWATVQIESDLPPVRADVVAIRLVLSNLIDNAIRYTTDSPYLRVSAGRRQGSAVLVEVEDHGPGIPAGELKDVTRKFFRGRLAGSGGSGLG